eukprot:CAMPEP_0167766260 /NCGR_PEP_ID=MMETSP0110_2-20121227/15237_1 /TAXON_ID=629695 /ORGANISM="Gymnochlora sp., Strain CCMP2014" /LENGTH=72 /DNA_ID=CAMNT_0007654251 /DNA_START=1215 /DNA_END=1434 /DNA_ORIENTATION=+
MNETLDLSGEEKEEMDEEDDDEAATTTCMLLEDGDDMDIDLVKYMREWQVRIPGELVNKTGAVEGIISWTDN